MANILSQEEIDALMGAVEEEEASEEVEDSEDGEEVPASPGQVVLYDFRRPNRTFFKEQLRIFQTIHDSFARQFGQSLSGYLRSMVEIEIISADQLTYGEYVLSLPGTSSLFTFDLEPLEGRGVIEINPALILSMVDRLFGGVGAQAEFTRDLTDIETAVMTKLVQRALSVLAKAWESVIKLQPTLRDYETKPVMMQLLPNTESVVLITFELRMVNNSGTLSVCYPYTSMEPIIPRVTGSQLLKRRTVVDNLARRWVGEAVESSEIEMIAELGTAHLSVGEFLNLHVGDIISLDRWSREAVDLKVAGAVKAKCHPGLEGMHRVVQVENVVEPDVAMVADPVPVPVPIPVQGGVNEQRA